MRLTTCLSHWRAERPDEWKMDEFIRQAALLESAILVLTKASSAWAMSVSDSEEEVIGRLVNEIETKA